MNKDSVPSIGRSIRALAKHAVDAGAPCNIFTGTVVSAEPLSIRVSQDFVLSAEFLTLTNAVKDHAVDVSVSWKTVDDNYLDGGLWKHNHSTMNMRDWEDRMLYGNTDDDLWWIDTTHHHDIQGRKKIIIHNGLTVGEMVLLLREQGGQNYIVLDRLTEAKTEGEWL